MNITETDNILTAIANVDNRKVDDATVLVWHRLIGHLDHADCLDAVATHFQTSERYLMPVHIITGVAAIKRERRRIANERKALESAPKLDPRPLTDRSAEIQGVVDSVREVLPEGKPDSLRHNHGLWRRVKEGRERQENAVPNPYYDPQAIARLARMEAETE